MFPSGLPGIALLILRTSVAITVLLHGYSQRQDLAAWLLACLLLLAITLIAGFLTPILALISAAVQFIGPWAATKSTSGLLVVSILNALALALLGPGAYSFDAVRFGRRVVDLLSDIDG
jgi:putative oxidoreductase